MKISKEPAVWPSHILCSILLGVSGRVLVPESYPFPSTTLAWTEGAVPEGKKKRSHIKKKIILLTTGQTSRHAHGEADHIGANKQGEHMCPEPQALRHSALQPPVKCSHMNVLDLDQSDLQIFRWRGELHWQLASPG